MSRGNQEREGFLDDLAPIVDGEPDALERHGALLADDDALRDLRHEAAETARAVADAGADYEPPTDMEARVLAALGTGGEASPAATAAPEPEPTADAAPEPTADAAPEPSAAPTADAALEAESAAEAPPEAPPSATTRGAGAGPSPKVVAIAAVALGGMGLAAAAVLALVGYQMFGGGADEAAVVDTTGGTTGKLVRTVRAADEPISGVSLRVGEDEGFHAAVPGAELPAGAEVRTDARTRAEITLADGSEIVLDHGTHVVLSPKHQRRLEVRSGQLVADVTHLEDGTRALFETPHGEVEVLGTKFVITASEAHTAVRVTRGTVRVHGAGEKEALVHAGEEAELREDRAPAVAPAVDLASSVTWSELDRSEDKDAPLTGIGELRAKKPGEREDRERPLHLARHIVKTRIVGNVARTEIEETFRNESGDVLEGIYRFPVPPGARIASLSLEVDGKWETGAFVERDHAKKIWRGVIRNATPEQQRQKEEFVWVPGPWRDPALLEWQKGGRFELRIFPIPARGERHIRIAYTETLAPHADGRRYVYPLAHSADESTRVGRFEMDVRIAGEADVRPQGYAMKVTPARGSRELRYAADSFLPAGDIIIDHRVPGDEAEVRWWTFRGEATAAPPDKSREVEDDVLDTHRALHGDDRPYVAFALRPELPPWAETRARDYVLVVDSSQSMVGERYTRARKLVAAMVGEMDRRDRFVVLACDATCDRMSPDFEIPSAPAAERAAGWLDKRRPAGSSDLTAALRFAAESARASGDREVHLLYVGDGTATVGPRRASLVAAEVEALASRDRLTVGTVGIGADADATVLGAMARAGGGVYTTFAPGASTISVALSVLEGTFGSALERPVVEMPSGVTEVAPSSLGTLRVGREVVVVGRLTGEDVSGDLVLRGEVGGRPWENRYPVNLKVSTSKGNAFVPRLWAQKRIEDLELEGKGEDRAKIIALSKAFGVMSRHTSLLVLESEAMFRAFGVDRQRPTVEWTGEEEDMEYGATDGDDKSIPAVSMAAARVSGRSASRRKSMRFDDSLASPFGSIGGGGSSGAGYGRGATSGASGAMDRVARPEPAPAAEPVAEAEAEAPRTTSTSRAAQERSRARPRPSPPRTRRPGRWMRRVWTREGSVHSETDMSDRDRAAVTEAEAALQQNPDSRDRHRALVRALSRAGQLERAVDIAEKWLERDPLDPEALTYLSDAVGRLGRRDEALRLLTGIVDLAPDNDKLQLRLAAAFDRAGMPERACAHRVALADIKVDKADVVADAVRCERALGRTDAATRLLEATPDEKTREEAAKGASRADTPRRPKGELMLDASWDGNTDVDLTLVTPQGTRLSFMGGRVHVVGEGATRKGEERLGLRRVTPGRYMIEVNRADRGDRSPVQGRIRVEILGERRTLPFALAGERTVVGQVQVKRTSQLVPM